MGCLGFTIAGGVLEVIGFGLIAAEITRIQWREFGTPLVVRRIEAFVRRIVRRPRSRTVVIGAADAIALADSARVRVTRAPVEGLEARVARLEHMYDDIRGELDSEIHERQQAIERVRSRIEVVEGEVSRHQHEAEQARRAEVRRHIAVQGWAPRSSCWAQLSPSWGTRSPADSGFDRLGRWTGADGAPHTRDDPVSKGISKLP